MCGIIAAYEAPGVDIINIADCIEKIYPRGPDDMGIKDVGNDVILGFSRLAINGNDGYAQQPFQMNGVTLVCNGEIFNHKELEEELCYQPKSGSDCEVLIPAYHRWGAIGMCEKLDAEFAFILYDKRKDRIVAARDPYGVRPLFKGQVGYAQGHVFASEMKAIIGIPNVRDITQFKPGHVMVSSPGIISYETYLTPSQRQVPSIHSISPPNPEFEVYNLLCNAVKKRMMCENGGVCCLLSGGLDSSLVSALAQRYSDEPIHTFSIGLEGSPDLKYAKKVANHIKSIHHEVLVTEEDFIAAIPEVIRVIESYDTTTVRASVGNYLVAKYIRENTDFKVVLNGDYADEVCGGYLYLKLAPSKDAFEEERSKLLKNIHYFDSLRSDRCICAWGLEARAPFADRDFVKYYTGIDSSVSAPRDQCEKWLLRFAFDKTGLLPNEILWRQKEAFSDGVSSTARSWYTIAAQAQAPLPEDEYYKKIFCQHYGVENMSVIPYKWMPKWGNTNDPSARTLDIYLKP